jgi:hypothetical protein
MAPMRAHCWIVEGSGFARPPSAALRASDVQPENPIPCHVAVDIRGALHWMPPHLAWQGAALLPTGAMAAIEVERCGHDVALWPARGNSPTLGQCRACLRSTRAAFSACVLE